VISCYASTLATRRSSRHDPLTEAKYNRASPLPRQNHPAKGAAARWLRPFRALAIMPLYFCGANGASQSPHPPTLRRSNGVPEPRFTAANSHDCGIRTFDRLHSSRCERKPTLMGWSDVLRRHGGCSWRYGGTDRGGRGCRKWRRGKI